MSENPFLTNLLGRVGRLVVHSAPPPPSAHSRALEPGEVVLVRATQYAVYIMLLYSDGCLLEYPVENVQVAAEGDSWAQEEYQKLLQNKGVDGTQGATP